MFNILQRVERTKKKTPRAHTLLQVIISVEWYYIFNILFTVKLNEDVGGGAVIG